METGTSSFPVLASLTSSVTGTTVRSQAGAQYINGANYAARLTPPSDQFVGFRITSFAFEGCCDWFRVFNGATFTVGSSPTPWFSLNGVQTNRLANPFGFYVSQTAGTPLSLQLTSDGSVINTGWVHFFPFFLATNCVLFC